MNTKTIIAAGAGAITAYLLGWLLWGILLEDYYTNNMVQYAGLMKEPPLLWLVFIANLATAFLFAWLFSRMNVRTFAGGFQAGAIIAVLYALSNSLMYYAFMNWYQTPAVIGVDLLVNAVYGGLVGSVIALMLGRGTKTDYA